MPTEIPTQNQMTDRPHVEPCYVGLVRVGYGPGVGYGGAAGAVGRSVGSGLGQGREGGRERQRTTRSAGRYDVPTKKTQLRATLLRKERRRCQIALVGLMMIYAHFGVRIADSRQCGPGSMKQVSGVGVGAGSCVRTMSCGSRIGPK